MTKGLWGTCGWGDTCLLCGGQAPTPGRLHCSLCIQTHGSWGGGAAQRRGAGEDPCSSLGLDGRPPFVGPGVHVRPMFLLCICGRWACCLLPSSVNSPRGAPLICISNSWAEDMTFGLWTPREHCLNERMSQGPGRKASQGRGLDGE